MSEDSAITVGVDASEGQDQTAVVVSRRRPDGTFGIVEDFTSGRATGEALDLIASGHYGVARGEVEFSVDGDPFLLQESDNDLRRRIMQRLHDDMTRFLNARIEWAWWSAPSTRPRRGPYLCRQHADCREHPDIAHACWVDQRERRDDPERRYARHEARKRR